MFTEDEAKTKWCPFVRLVGNHGAAAPRQHIESCNRISLGLDEMAAITKGMVCMGSDCMAWRPVNQWRVRSDYPWQNGTPRGDFARPNNETRTLGYCGAFGKVEP